MASEETIKQVLAMLSAEYPEHVNKLSAEQLRNLRELYTLTLADIGDDDLRAGALRHVNESNWFPKISEPGASRPRRRMGAGVQGHSEIRHHRRWHGRHWHPAFR